MSDTIAFIRSSELKRLCVEALLSADVPESDAETVADSLVEANLRGVDSHGVIRLPKYVKGLRARSINPTPRIKVTRSAEAVIQVDGDNGLGAVVGARAMEALLQICPSCGIAAAGIRRSNHFGTIMYYLLKAVGAGYIGIGFAHGESLQVPFGGQTPFFGTNPMAFAFPTGKAAPVVVDFATSATTFGKLAHARVTGTPLPDGLVLDGQGGPTTDPSRAAKILPAAGHKGYGLAFAVEVLAALLNACPFATHVPPVFRDDVEQPGNLGHLFVVIDPRRFAGAERFVHDIDAMIDELHALPPARGAKGVLVPGEPESVTYSNRLRDGIPLSRGVVAALEALGESSTPRANRAARRD